MRLMRIGAQQVLVAMGTVLKALDQQHLGLWSKCGKNLQRTPCAACYFCNVFGSSLPESQA